MVVLACSVPTCDIKTGDISEALVVALLANHGLAHHIAAPGIVGPSPAPFPRGPKLERPKVNIGVKTEEWNVFSHRWEVLCTGSGIAHLQKGCVGKPKLSASVGKASTTATMSRDVLFNGISDSDIRREVLGTAKLLKSPVNDVIALVENKDMARNDVVSQSPHGRQ